ncbi:hypothetical protein ABT224_19810 [Streptomyces sp. NPDC001584]|uniref:hypothetical protein n=1 Tax=Streptomyces sp. NPDC001584 TaxID=3154521 RepID=UPI0033282BAF
MAEMTVADLIAKLEEMDPGSPVRIAWQPAHAFEYTIGKVVEDEDGTCWIAEGDQQGYLSGAAKDALEWGRY